MASSISRDMEKAMADAMNEIDKKMEKAFQNAMKRIEPELFKVMRAEAVENYYAGYKPKRYKRTHQLHNAISIRLENRSDDDLFAFSVFPKYDETKMDHSQYDMFITYTRKDGHTYEYWRRVKLKNKPDEEAIMETTLGQGYHPKVGTMGTRAPIWTKDDNGILIDALDDYVKKHFENYFNEEYDKL